MRSFGSLMVNPSLFIQWFRTLILQGLYDGKQGWVANGIAQQEKANLHEWIG